MKCPFPDCFRDEHEDGDHQLGRPSQPRGVLTVMQEFNQLYPAPCDLQPEDKPRSHAPALGVYVDELRFTWWLCYGCVQVRDVQIGEHLLPANRKGAQRRYLRRRVASHAVVAFATPQSKGKVIKFRKLEAKA